MTLEISPQSYSAFESAAAVEELRDFFEWWTSRETLLGVMPDLAIAKQVLGRAEEASLELGIDDNNNHRIFLTAALMRLIPVPTGSQWLRAIDAVFDEGGDDGRLADIVAIARSPAS